MSCRHSFVKGPGQTGLEPGQATLPSQGLLPCPCFPFLSVCRWRGLMPHITYE
ncbi:rCG47055 [Rattus norvegicus]|uniref:RCG47055 n=1 Tax=Rattus norvegicus TaxID=10116 RepID=A6KU30_RAT|nr:rCG47055 [Rattus norvegicus]